MKKWSDSIPAAVTLVLTLLVGAVSLIPYFIFLAITESIFPGSYWLMDFQSFWKVVGGLASTWVIFLILEVVAVTTSTALATMFEQPLKVYRMIKVVVEIGLISLVSAFWISPLWAAMFASILYAVFTSLTEPLLDRALKKNGKTERGF
ncbi:hypothetical protein [Corynebacterium mustelae]|uniref:hypothetical protein n=1 Tax=Corynebacterium mustelae TaxID=571915 RepID=UPI001187630D|nr:hypothetical protein [Corynebacterium mustelae]